MYLGSKFDAASESEGIFEKYPMVQELQARAETAIWL